MKLLLAGLIFGMSIICVGFASAETSAKEFLGFIPAQDQETIARTHELVVFGDKLADLRLWKGSPFAEVLQAEYKDFDTSLVAECIFVIDRPAIASGRDLEKKILQSFTAFSTMKGLQAYSESQQKMETFIYESYQVDSVENHKQLPDPEVQTQNGQAHYVVYEKEEQTGDMFNQFVLIPHGTWYEVRLENLSDIKYGPFTLVGAHKFKTSYFIFPTTDKIIVYGINLADTLRFLGIEKSKRSSFSNRMRAIESWFAAGLGAKSGN